MTLLSPASPMAQPVPAWSATVLMGVVIPAMLLIALWATSTPLIPAIGPIFTLALMGVGIIAASIIGRFSIGVILALLNAACLMVLALALGMPAPSQPAAIALAMIIASCSFTARGALFAKTMAHRGWWMALFVVAGEASVLLIVAIWPGVLPLWFLALLPAQWASIAIQTAMNGESLLTALPVLIALAGTATTTLLAARLWMRPWPYPLMFTAWLGLSAMVWKLQLA